MSGNGTGELWFVVFYTKGDIVPIEEFDIVRRSADGQQGAAVGRAANKDAALEMFTSTTPHLLVVTGPFDDEGQPARPYSPELR